MPGSKFKLLPGIIVLNRKKLYVNFGLTEPINKHLPNVRGEERCTLLPVAGDVDNPMLPRSLLFIMSLVLRSGIRIIDCRSSIRVLCITVGRDNMIVHFGC